MRAAAIFFFAMGLAGLAGCQRSSSTTPTGPGGLPAGPAGTWQATRAEYVWGNMRLDAVAMGATMGLALDANGSYVLTVKNPSQAPEVTEGTWSASADVLRLRPAGMTWDIEFDMAVNETTLTLAGGHVAYDINGDDADEECVLTATWARQ